MKFQNILKIGDLYVGQLKPATIEFLQNSIDPAWIDANTEMLENMYNIRQALEMIKANEIKQPEHAVLIELTKIKQALDRKDCGYLRIVYS